MHADKESPTREQTRKRKAITAIHTKATLGRTEVCVAPVVCEGTDSLPPMKKTMHCEEAVTRFGPVICPSFPTGLRDNTEDLSP